MIIQLLKIIINKYFFQDSDSQQPDFGILALVLKRIDPLHIENKSSRSAIQGL